MFSLLTSLLALVAGIAALACAIRERVGSRRELEQLRQRSDELTKMLRLRGMLASEMAHDIKNPLTAILCSAEALDLLIGERIEPIHRVSLHYIRDYGESLLRLVSNFLDISRAEANHLQRRPERTGIVQLTQSIIGLLQAFAVKRKVTVRFISVQESLVAHVDPTHVKQILFNLVHNAIKYSKEGGEVTIMMKSEFPLPSVHIEVSDLGVGIPEERLQRIFDPYARFEQGDAVENEGLGLGLALCKELVSIECGRIEVRSKVGIGTTFTVTLPLADEHDVEAEAGAQQSETDPHPLVGQRFLLVDEDSGAREAIATLIEAWGGMVDRVAAAAEAVEAIARTDYDAVMIDSVHDGLEAHELARLMRVDLEGGSTKIFISGRRKEHEDLALKAGVDGFLEKPLNGRALLHSLVRSGKYSLPH